jgi:hypothetical protein
MFQRRYQLGEEVTLRVRCTDSSGRPVEPDAAPRLAVYASTGGPVKDVWCSVVDKHATVGWFEAKVFLGADFSAGWHHAVARWLDGGTHHGAQEFAFEVVAGGSETGQVVALHSYERPHADFLVQQRTSGRIYKGRNPRVA